MKTRILSIYFICFFTIVLNHINVHAQQSIKLYEGKAPGSENWQWTEGELKQNQFGTAITFNVVEPELFIYLPPKEKRTGTSIVIAPGGAFHILSMDSEGHDVAKWLNERGIAAFVIKYRLARTIGNDPIKELMPLMADFKKLDSINAPIVEFATTDGITTMQYVKSHAKDWGLNPEKIGFMGFSAGGTLTMSVLLSAPQEWKPNFVAPIYLYGPAVIGNQMPKNQTPMFIGVASDDQLKFVPHSIELYNKWMSSNNPVEMHIYEKGGHGFGMRKQNTSSDHWTSDFENWLKVRKLM